MRRIFTLLTIILLPASIYSQLSGDGSSSSPFYGTITSNVEWDWESIGDNDGYIYVGTSSANDLTIASGGHLTIYPGATVVFTQPGSDLIVTGNGRITADANPGAAITFTKASGNSNWGHLIFDGMSGSNPSLIDNCIFEYGRLTGTTLSYPNAGGGICANYSYVTIQNSTFRNNYALFGGGIFVGYGQNPTIRNCIFEDNTAREAGGAIYIYNYSAVQIENCIFDGNHAEGVTTFYYAGGGVQFGAATTNARVINSTFVNNTATRSGDAVYFYTAGGVVNCIFWGSDDQVAFRTTTGTVTNSAVHGYLPSSHYIDCFDLNSTNSATDGPNFIAIDGSDWSVRFTSPLRDAGITAEAPTTDLIGNPRIGPADIGALEVQYGRWTGSSGTSWTTASNWEAGVVPVSASSDIVIPSGASNFPVTPGNSYMIGNGRFLEIEPTAKVTFDVLTNNGGTVRILSDATGIASLLFNSYSDNGSEHIEMFLTGGGGPDYYKWHYIAVPAGMSKATFVNVNPYNLLLFDDSKIVTTNMEGWQWHDGYDGTTGFSSLLAKRGYNFYHTEDVTVTLPTLNGLLSSMGSTVPLQFNGNGLNLIGNSLTCSLNWDQVILSGNMRNAVYFTTNNTMASYVGGVGTPAGTTGLIPPLQGFFVKALETGCAMDFSAAGVKTHSSVNRYKSDQVIPLLRLELHVNNLLNDETVVRFSYDATTSFDNNMDASKMFAESAPVSTIWSTLENEDYAINSIPYPSVEFYLPLTVIIKQDGTHSIKRTEITGLEDYRAELIDNYQSFSTDLKSADSYSFGSTAGTFDDRFMVKITPMATGLDDLFTPVREINMFISGNILNIQPSGDLWGQSPAVITVTDITGRAIQRYTGIQLQGGSLLQLPFNRPSGLYIVEVIEGNRRFTGKVVNR